MTQLFQIEVIHSSYRTHTFSIAAGSEEEAEREALKLAEQRLFPADEEYDIRLTLGDKPELYLSDGDACYTMSAAKRVPAAAIDQVITALREAGALFAVTPAPDNTYRVWTQTEQAEIFKACFNPPPPTMLGTTPTGPEDEWPLLCPVCQTPLAATSSTRYFNIPVFAASAPYEAEWFANAPHVKTVEDPDLDEYGGSESTIESYYCRHCEWTATPDQAQAPEITFGYIAWHGGDHGQITVEDLIAGRPFQLYPDNHPSGKDIEYESCCDGGHDLIPAQGPRHEFEASHWDTVKEPAPAQAYINIVCGTPDCEHNGKAVNTVTLPSNKVDLFMESFGQGGEEKADYCPKCHCLGEAVAIGYDQPATATPAPAAS